MENQLSRFIGAQSETYGKALSEIKSGRKTTHWMWFIFPQLKGLGRSDTAQFYGIENLEEAIVYFNHPVLGKRLVEISRELLQIQGKTATAIFGSPDDVKLHSSMTLFACVPGADPVFQKVIDGYYDGRKDQQTLDLLGLN